MLDLSRLICGTDFSETSAGSVREALRLATLGDARRVTVVHVTQAPEASWGELDERLASWLSALPGYTALADQDRVEREVIAGTISQGIAKAARSRGAGLIVVGPLRHGLMERLFLGGVAEQLFEQVNMPVLATRAPAPKGYRRILVSVDFSPASIDLLKVAAALARQQSPHGRLHLLHAYTLPGGVHALAARRQMEATYQSALVADLKQLVAEAGADDLSIEYDVAYGVARDVILKTAKAQNSDVVCMGSFGAGGVGRKILGSTLGSVIQDIQRPMLVV